MCAGVAGTGALANPRDVLAPLPSSRAPFYAQQPVPHTRPLSGIPRRPCHNVGRALCFNPFVEALVLPHRSFDNTLVWDLCQAVYTSKSVSRTMARARFSYSR